MCNDLYMTSDEALFVFQLINYRQIYKTEALLVKEYPSKGFIWLLIAWDVLFASLRKHSYHFIVHHSLDVSFPGAPSNKASFQV